MGLFVGNIAFVATDADLQQLFTPHGRILAARIATDCASGRSRGFGVVEMPDAGEAQTAIAALHGTALEGRPRTVNQAQPREKRGIPRGPRW